MFAGVNERLVITVGRNKDTSPSIGSGLGSYVTGTGTTGMPGSGVREVVGGTSDSTSSAGCRTIACRNCNPGNITMVIRTLASGEGEATNRMERCFSGFNNGVNARNYMDFVFSGGNILIVRHRSLRGSRSAIVDSTLRYNTSSFRTSSSMFAVCARASSFNTMESRLRGLNCAFISTRVRVIPDACAGLRSRRATAGVRGVLSVFRSGSSVRGM